MDVAAWRERLPESSDDRLALRPSRSNAREADRLVLGRLFEDLKGVALPVHVMVDEGCGRRPGRFVVPRKIPCGFPRRFVVSLGGGLHVLAPEAAVVTSGLDAIAMAKMLFEICGLFSLLPSNARLDLALSDLLASGAFPPGGNAFGGMSGYSDERGRPLGRLGPTGESLPWVPAIDRRGSVTDLWKRPPLTSVEHVAQVVDGLDGVVGLTEARHALAVTRDGSASPAETLAYLMLCSGAWFGGEAWGRPDLNRCVPFTPQAKALAGTSYAVADLLWADRKVDLEVQGKAFHADDLGFTRESGRRAALESMGYAVLEITYAQMANLELLDAMLPTFAGRLGFPLRHRSVAFLRRRDALHRALFGRPYDPD